MVHVGLVRYIFNTSDLSKLASYKNSFLESNEKVRKNNMFDNTVKTKNLILELIPPKKIKIFFDNSL